jgi:hypothetical protein
MSHIVQARTGIVLPKDAQERARCMELLRRTIEVVAAHFEGGKVTDHYLNYRRRRLSPTTGLAIRSREMWRGIGLNIDGPSGELRLDYDPWEAWDGAEAMKNEITQTYLGLATMQALQEMGWSAQALTGEEGDLVVLGTGVLYA